MLLVGPSHRLTNTHEPRIRRQPGRAISKRRIQTSAGFDVNGEGMIHVLTTSNRSPSNDEHVAEPTILENHKRELIRRIKF